MLFGYFDESGIFAPKKDGGHLLKFTIGGCVASFDEWEGMSLNWAGALAGMNIPMFHMTDFESRTGHFNGWTEANRKARLNTLLEIIGSIKPHCYGFTNIVRAGEEDLPSIYERCAQEVLLALSRYSDDLSIIFAHHPEYKRHRGLYDAFVGLGMEGKIRSCTTAHPVDILPLQAADIVAYEVRCEAREGEREGERPMRYPLNTLIDFGCSFRFSSAVD